jgi:AcrR family transcriptional regulator
MTMTSHSSSDRRSPSRRERIRSATAAEIKALARKLLVSGGPAAISLRAIAREMGMTAPAIYRYFPSLDALVVVLTEDLYDELRETIEAARSDGNAVEPIHDIVAMSRAFRGWCVSHPAEFGLMFGSPVPGVSSFEEECIGPDHAGARFGAPFLEAFTRQWRARPFTTPPAQLITERLGPYLAPYRETFGDEVPVEVIYAYLSGWTRLYGLVAMEVFGHLRWAVTDVEPLFEVELAAFVNEVTAAGT